MLVFFVLILTSNSPTYSIEYEHLRCYIGDHCLLFDANIDFGQSCWAVTGGVGTFENSGHWLATQTSTFFDLGRIQSQCFGSTHTTGDSVDNNGWVCLAFKWTISLDA